MRSTSPHPTLASLSLRRAMLSMVVGVTLLVGVLPAFTGAALAQDAPAPEAGAASTPQTWTLKPATPEGPDSRAHFVYDVTPGQTISDTVAVTNFGDQPLQLRVYARDAFTPEGGGFDLLARADAPVDVGRWIRLDTDAVALAPRQTVLIPATITVPANASPGDHSGGIVAGLVTTTTNATGEQVAVENRVGARVYVRVDGPLVPRLDIIDLTARHQGSLTPLGRGTVDARYTVVNSGNVRLSGTQVATVTGPAGVELGRAVLADLPELLPGASIDQEVRLERIWPAGRITTAVDIQPVDATGSVAVDPTHQSTSQWAIPWTLLGIAAIIAGALVLGIRRRHRGPSEPTTGSMRIGATVAFLVFGILLIGEALLR